MCGIVLVARGIEVQGGHPAEQVTISPDSARGNDGNKDLPKCSKIGQTCCV